MARTLALLALVFAALAGPAWAVQHRSLAAWRRHISASGVAGALVTDSAGTLASDESGTEVLIRDKAACYAVGECERCTREAQGWATGLAACRSTGYRQQHVCKEAVAAAECDGGADCADQAGAGEDGAAKMREARVYMSCTPKAGGPDSVVWFETAMVLGAAGSLYVVWQRKVQAYQRLSNIVNN